MIYERRKKARRLAWEVVDVDCAIAFHATTPEERDSYRVAIELVNHRVLIKEVTI